MIASGRASPHPVLGDWYPDERARRPFLNRIFDDAAPFYNRINALISLGSGAWYRLWALRRAGLLPGMKVLDVATGTGAVARPAARVTGPSGLVVGIDPSLGMLSEQSRRRRFTRLARGVAERLPFADQAFDFLSMGYALRHVPDLGQTFGEYRRVLKPGGTLLILDFCRPAGRVGYPLARFYLKRVIPWVVGLVSGGRTSQRLMEYCWDTVNECVPPAEILDRLQSEGFEQIRTERYGVLCEYHARSPATPGSPGAS